MYAIRSYYVIVEEETFDIQAHEEIGGIDPSIFRAYDIRGIVDRTLTAQAVELVGRAIGSEALQRGRNTVVVGRDGRLSGPIVITSYSIHYTKLYDETMQLLLDILEAPVITSYSIHYTKLYDSRRQ